jgi:hypothetical protein
MFGFMFENGSIHWLSKMDLSLPSMPRFESVCGGTYYNSLVFFGNFDETRRRCEDCDRLLVEMGAKDFEAPNVDPHLEHAEQYNITVHSAIRAIDRSLVDEVIRRLVDRNLADRRFTIPAELVPTAEELWVEAAAAVAEEVQDPCTCPNWYWNVGVGDRDGAHHGTCALSAERSADSDLDEDMIERFKNLELE